MQSTPSATDDYEFQCEKCEQCISVNEEMQDGLLEYGCPVCGAPVDVAAFRRTA